MERNNFSDLVREVLIRELRMRVIAEPELLNDLSTGKTKHFSIVEQLVAEQPNIEKELKRNLKRSKETDPDLQEDTQAAQERLSEIVTRRHLRDIPII